MCSSKRKNTVEADEESWEASRKKPSRASVLLSRYEVSQPVFQQPMSPSTSTLSSSIQSTSSQDPSKIVTVTTPKWNSTVSKGSGSKTLTSNFTALIPSYPKSSSSSAGVSAIPSGTHSQFIEVIDLTIGESEENKSSGILSPPEDHRHMPLSQGTGNAKAQSLTNIRAKAPNATLIQALTNALASPAGEPHPILPPSRANLSSQIPTLSSSQQTPNSHAPKAKAKKLSDKKLALAAAARPQTRIIPPEKSGNLPQGAKWKTPFRNKPPRIRGASVRPSAGAPNVKSRPFVIIKQRSQSQLRSLQSHSRIERQYSRPPRRYAAAQAREVFGPALSREAAGNDSEESELDDEDSGSWDQVVLSSVEERGEDGLNEMESGDGHDLAMANRVRDKNGKFARARTAERNSRQQTLKYQTTKLLKIGQREILSSNDEEEYEIIPNAENEQNGDDSIPTKESLAAMKLALLPTLCGRKLSSEQAKAIKTYMSKLEVFRDAQYRHVDDLQDSILNEKENARITVQKNIALNDKCGALAKKLSRLESAAAKQAATASKNVTLNERYRALLKRHTQLEKLEKDMVKAGVTRDLLRNWRAMEKEIETLRKTSSDQRSQVSQLEGIRLSHKHQVESLKKEILSAKDNFKKLEENLIEVEYQRKESDRKAWKHEETTSMLSKEIERLKRLEAADVNLKTDMERLKLLRDINARLEAKLELLKPLADVGAKVRKGFMEQSKIRVFGPSSSMNRIIMHEATDAAHLYSALADYSLLQAGYWDEEKNGDLFKLVYGIDKWHDLEQDEVVRNMMAMPDKP